MQVCSDPSGRESRGNWCRPRSRRNGLERTHSISLASAFLKNLTCFSSESIKDIRKRVYELPPLGKKAMMVAIPTTSGTGSEVTPFAVVTDQKNGIKYPLTDYALTPNLAIIDPEVSIESAPSADS